jgi:hypothetical protein
MNTDQFALLFFVAFSALLFISLRRRREALRHSAKKFIAQVIATVAAGIFMLIATDGNTRAATICSFLAFVVVDLSFPERKRRIPAKVRRRVIARHELETGDKFNPQKDEIDHLVPFSRGGSSTFDNLKVISKKQNREKADKSPWWDIFGG